METKVYITFLCPDCDEEIKHGLRIFHEENEIPEISWDTASQESFHCEKCEKTWYTTDFEYLSEDEI